MHLVTENTSDATRFLRHISYACTITPRDLDDGISKNRRTGMFRARFKDALMSATAEGFGQVIAKAGKVHVPYLKKQCAMEGYTPLLRSKSHYA